MITQVGRVTGQLERQTALGVAAQLLLLAVLWSTVGLGPVGWLTGTLFGVTVCAVLLRSRKPALGPADKVTLTRATLVGGITALVTDAGGDAHIGATVTMTALALMLDFVDGLVARRTGTASSLGARFDMEVDAFLLLVLSIYLAFALGLWVIAIGGMRYAFVAAARALPWMNAPLPPSFARKTVAALQGIVLLVAAAGILPGFVNIALVALALTSLVWSFTRDVVWLWQSRPRCGRVGSVPAARYPAERSRATLP
ncbi:CDP-alcohol phosphatidyltransferase family protein [Streptomyces ovatisporus]|uniref:CDP-alcohol phosphatidyltransferase family protein n=1 Tax=Streptomyces ovatisporus TaxID=1128682 RepID=A0ABV9AC38_9ACTN